MVLVRAPKQSSLDTNPSEFSSLNCCYDTSPNDKRQSSLKDPDLFSRLPDEIIEHIGRLIQVPSWPPSHCVFTNWNQRPSPKSQENLLSLARACRRLYRIVTPVLMYEVERNLDKKYRTRPLPYQSRYKWLDSYQVWPLFRSIRILHLRDLSHYVESPVSMHSLLDALSPLADSLEVLVLTGFCASVLLETMPLRPTFKLGNLVTLKLYVYTLSAEAIYSVYKACPNLTSLALDVMNFKEGTLDQVMPVSVAVTHLDLGTRLYLEPECATLELILRPLIPTLRLVSIHGEFHDGLAAVLASLTHSPLTHLAMCFRNSFPRSLMSVQFRSLRKLSISTYAGPMLGFWSAPLLRTVTHLSLRANGLPEPPESSNDALVLIKFKLQSLDPSRDINVEWSELEELREWCRRRGVDFINCSYKSCTIESSDAYDDLLNWKIDP